MEPALDADILGALRGVLDPELGVDIVSLGLVYGAEREGELARVTLTMTSRACPLSGMIQEEARTAVESLVEGVRRAEVELVFEPLWSPERMSPEARAQLGAP